MVNLFKVGLAAAAVLGLGTLGTFKACTYDSSHGYKGSLIQRAREESEVVGGVSFPFDADFVTTGYTGENAENVFYGCLVKDRKTVRQRIVDGRQEGESTSDIYRKLEDEGLITQYVINGQAVGLSKEELWRAATNFRNGRANPRFHLSENAITQFNPGVEKRQYDADKPMEVVVLSRDGIAFRRRYDFDQIPANSDGSVRVPVGDDRMPDIPEHGPAALRKTRIGEMIRIDDTELKRYGEGASTTVNNGLDRLQGTVNSGNDVFERVFLNGAESTFKETEADRAAKLKRAEELLSGE